MKDYDRYLEDDRELLESYKPNHTNDKVEGITIYCVHLVPMKAYKDILKPCIESLTMNSKELPCKVKEFLEKSKNTSINTLFKFSFGTVAPAFWVRDYKKQVKHFKKLNKNDKSRIN